MTNCVIKNSTEKPVRILIKRDSTSEAFIIYPKSQKEMSKLAGAILQLPIECDLTLRYKKIVPGGFALMAKVIKSEYFKVKELQLPDVFMILKIKKTY